MRTTMRSLSLWVVVALVAGGCANYKEPARLALQDVEYALIAVSSDAKKYAPDEYAKLEQQYATAKKSYAEGHYEATVQEVRELRENISQVSMASAAARDQKVAALNQQWQSMSADLPKMVDAIAKRLESLSKSKKLPKNIDPSNFEAAKAGFEDVKKTWDEASQASEAGNLETAVSKGSVVQSKGQEIMTLLGMPTTSAA